VRLHITTDDTGDRNHGQWFVNYLVERAITCRFRVHDLVATPDAADAILILARGDEYSTELRRHPLVREQYRRVFVYDVKDRPIPFLPGLYCSLPRRRFNPDRHAAVGYIAPINPEVAAVAAGPPREPDLFFSFVGADNAPVRRRLFRATRGWTPRPDVLVEASYGWASRGKCETERRFAENLARSRFVLCPRGVGTSTYRLFEAMEVGRVPVILSDAWVPPDGPDWERFAIRLPERAVGELPAILGRYTDRAAEMGRAARAAWEEWFAPDVQFHRLAEAVGRLMAGGHAHVGWGRWTWRPRAAAARVTRTLDVTARTLAKRVLRALGRRR
jgi:hypothetical protein